jgi:hypothetical protein
VHTVELLQDESLERGVRELWARLRDAGLPSLADHPHPTNRPHLTVVTAASLAGLPPLPVPVAAELGPVTFLGRALVRAVTPTGELRQLHAAAWNALDDAWPPPAQWVPHISLALRVPEERRAEALLTLGDLPAARGQFTAVRSYDTRTRLTTDL